MLVLCKKKKLWLSNFIELFYKYKKIKRFVAAAHKHPKEFKPQQDGEDKQHLRRGDAPEQVRPAYIRKKEF